MPVVDYYRQRGKVVEVSRSTFLISPSFRRFVVGMPAELGRSRRLLRSMSYTPMSGSRSTSGSVSLPRPRVRCVNATTSAISTVSGVSHMRVGIWHLDGSESDIRGSISIESQRSGYIVVDIP
jgi:hypothetical protein